MAETIVSPGVFTREKDLTFLAEGVSAIGAAVIGPTEKGPAFTPVQVTSQNEFTTKFGPGTYYTPYTVQNYLKNAGIVTIVRVLGIATYSISMFSIVDNTGNLMAVLAASGSGAEFTDVYVAGTADDFAVTLSSGSSAYSASFNTTKNKYITNVFTSTNPAYVYLNFPTVQSASIADGGATALDTGSLSTVTFPAYSQAYTPWVTSQEITSGSNDMYNLFKFHTLSDGEYANREIKVGIFDVKFPDEVAGSDYGEFSVTIRVFGDTDSRPEVIETFTNLTLDPNSINYLPRAIGDRYGQYQTIGGESKLVYTGDWPNISKYVRVEMNPVSFPAAVVPFGFNAYSLPYNDANYPKSESYVTTQTINGETNTRAYMGIDFTDGDTSTLFNVLPSTTGTGSNIPFKLGDYVDGGSGSVANRKFIFGFQGGSNGYDPRIVNAQGVGIRSTNTQRFDCSSAAASGSAAYKKAIDSIANPDEIDVNMLLIPGILYKYHSYVANYAINICEVRGDCFYIMDNNGVEDGVQDAVTQMIPVDTNYAGTYFPWVKILDPNTSKPLWAPPSVVMAGVFSFSDNVSQEWFAPAGLNRGGITEAVEAYTRLTHTERDTLYNGRVNPIASFPGEGVVAWGQKTLQAKASALDRINVRRLLINLKKYIASSSRYLVFEQNVTATRNRFLNIVNPYLESVQNRAGLYAFKVVMDDTNNTPDIIDRNQMFGQIYLQPTRTAEFIILDFNVLPTGATFPE